MLLSVLRDYLGLTGTKSGCGGGECGACTVLVNGNPVNSCIFPALDAEGSRIITVEGLAAGRGKLSLLQKCFVDYGAVQCGFCTPGMLVSAKSLLDKNPSPNPLEIRKAIQGNLCRCTGYSKIIEAVTAASRNILKVVDTTQTNIGKSTSRSDAVDHVQGASLFIADIKVPGVVHGKILRSEYAHAEILNINSEKAERLEGVLAIATGKDVPRGYFGVDLRDQLVFARRKVRHRGDAVAAVAAETEEIATRALKLIEVNYRPLPHVLDAEESMKLGAPIIHEKLSEYRLGFDTKRYGNVCTVAEVDYGDLEAGFADADVIVEEKYSTGSQHQVSLETHGAIAKIDSGDRIKVWTSSQKPFAIRRYLSDSLEIPISRIRVIASKVGGGFGGKLEMNIEPYAVILAKKAGRPVRIIYSREEEFYCTGGRHSTRYRIRSGVKKDGTICAREIEFIYDTGAYSGNGPTTTTLVCQVSTGLYRIPNMRIDGYCVYTNKMNFGSCRGPSAPQTAFAIESHMDSLAKKIKMDPLQFRLKNLLNPGEKTGLGQVLKNIDYKAVLKTAADKCGWNQVKAETEMNSKSSTKRGVGISCVFWLSGGWSASASVKINEDGTVIVTTGATDMGTGYLYTAVPQIVAEKLGIDSNRVTIVIGDTDTTGYDHGIGGSRGAYTIGGVAEMAASKVKKKLLQAAAVKLKTSPEHLETKNGKIWIKNNPEACLTFQDISYAEHMLYGGPLIGSAEYLPEMEDIDTTRVKGLSFSAFPGNTIGCHIAQVNVETGTGQVEITRYIAAHDTGRVINPQAAEGQIEGGVAQGIGFALTEEMKFDEDGVMINNSITDYKLPVSTDVPEIVPLICEIPSQSGPHGAKGLGEPTMAPVAGAVANAVFDATGVKLFSTPMTPEKIRSCIKAADSSQG